MTLSRHLRNALIALSHNEEISERLRREIRIELGDLPADGLALPTARATHERSL